MDKATKRGYDQTRRELKRLAGHALKGGKHRTRWAMSHFVAVDGEGWDDNYTLLAAYDGHEHATLYKQGERLTSRDIFDWFKQHWTTHKNSVYVCFGASYDFNHWLRDCPLTVLKAINENRAGRWWSADYKIDYRPRRSLRLSWLCRKADGSIVTESRAGKAVPRWEGVTIYDVFGFFQSSFVKAASGMLGEHPLLPAIADMKAQRAVFDASQANKIQAYNENELVVLHAMMQRFHEHLDTIGITLNSWHGAGAVASAIFKKYAIKQHIEPLSHDVEQAARYAYFGGRIELSLYGHTDETCYHADINSAYPDKIRNLPSLAGGEWQRVRRWQTVQTFAVYHVAWSWSGDNTDGMLFPFPHRAANGAVSFPACGEGWYWQPEIQAARHMVKVYPDFHVKIIEGYKFIPANDDKPFSHVTDWYHWRQQLLRDKDGCEKVVKLGLNSEYGKMAQNLGASKHPYTGEWQIPQYHNLAYAGYVTSATRAQIFVAALPIMSDVIMIQTDGIVARVAIPVEHSESKVLGGWESDTYQSLTAVQSGVYFYTTAAGNHQYHIRGFDLEDRRTGIATLSEDMVMGGWQAWYDKRLTPQLLELLTLGDYGTIPCQMTRFIALKGCLKRNDMQSWCRMVTSQKRLSLGPQASKRATIDALAIMDSNPATQLIPTRPIQPPNKMSAKYTRVWDDDGDGIDITSIDDEMEIAHEYDDLDM